MTIDDRALNAVFADTFPPEMCCLCTGSAGHTSIIGLPFCADHAFRGTLLDWGLSHDCPALDATAYGMSCTISHDAYHWYVTACLGTDELVWTLLGMIETEYGEVAA